MAYNRKAAWLRQVKVNRDVPIVRQYLSAYWRVKTAAHHRHQEIRRQYTAGVITLDESRAKHSGVKATVQKAWGQYVKHLWRTYTIY